MRCPECNSEKLWRDGLRHYDSGVSRQRWLCRDCGIRFSEPSQENSQWSINTVDVLPFRRQICVEETKNLATATETKTVAGEGEHQLKRKGHRYQRKPVDPDVRALADVFQSWLRKEGYAESNLYHHGILRLSRLGANLKDPESVKDSIAKHKIRNGGKLGLVYAYDALARMLGISWIRPTYKQEEIIPFIPFESELDQLIAAAHNHRFASYLQTLKETWPDPTEALRIERHEVQGNVVTINHPVKGHLPRQIEVSSKLVAMLNSLPEQTGRIFPMTYNNVCGQFIRLRARVAATTQNPRILQITLNSFRHWGGTMLAYYSNGNVLVVKKMLGHKRIENTMKYIGMIHFESSEMETTVSTNIEEDRAAVAAKFTYVTERNGIKLWQRPKRFSGAISKRQEQLVNAF